MSDLILPEDPERKGFVMGRRKFLFLGSLFGGALALGALPELPIRETSKEGLLLVSPSNEILRVTSVEKTELTVTRQSSEEARAHLINMTNRQKAIYDAWLGHEYPAGLAGIPDWEITAAIRACRR